MDNVSSEFHKNVHLLTEFIPAHDEFKKHFKEGMFEKPNTPGFIHVSYYLLNVHYKDSVRSKVQWPVIDKQTENKFRNDVRECLTVIANENSDITFPPIFASHLLLARGTKFLLIMWKFSLVVLRTYLEQEHECVISSSPKPGPCQEMTKTFLNNVTKNHHSEISDIRKERENIEQEANIYKNKKINEQSELKAKIFKLREDLKELVITAPVDDVGKKQLINVEKNKVITMWCDYTNNLLSECETNCTNLEKMDEFLQSISNIVLNLSGNSFKLNASNFDRINVEPIYKLVPPEKQVSLYNLYDNKQNLNLQNFFSVFNLMIQKYERNFKKHQLDDFSKCSDQLELSKKDIKVAASHFQNLHEQIVNFMDEIKKMDKSNDSHKVGANVSEYDQVLFMSSPSIQLNNCEGSRNYHENYLKLTPAEGAHKQLFSKHSFQNEKDIYSTMKKQLPVQRINFDDSTYDTSNDKASVSQQWFHTPVKLKCTFKNVDKYSRIFSTRRPKDNRVNNSVITMMSSTGTSTLPQINIKQHYISLMDSCNSSQEISQEPLLLNPHLNSTIEPSKVEKSEKPPPKSSKRRSIGDLVERYKKLIQKRDTKNSQDINSPVKEPLGE